MNEHSNYWSGYYSACKGNNSNHCVPSQFAAFCALEAKEVGIKKLIDIAAGDGRDSVFFAQLGFEVLSLEQSSSAIEIIKSRSQHLTNLKSVQMDVTTEQLPRFNAKHELSAYYARFFLHTLNEQYLRMFFKNLSNAMHSSKYFFTEYRNEKDISLRKYTPHHDRYFYNSAFIRTIAGDHSLRCIYETQGVGFAKWKTDDAVVTRQIFIKE